jgi:hypothetical protein
MNSEYDCELGELIAKVSMGARKKGRLLGARKPRGGYRVVTIEGYAYPIHRIAYAMFYGVDPYPLEVDHKDRVKYNNKIENLRAVTPKENMENIGWFEKSSGYWGITKYSENLWVVVVRKIYGGRFRTLEDAVSRRDELCRLNDITIPALCK